jgi:uncharacterized 2Fe-2S/4Fe-4S cluster protein (DUF4445 family)
MTGDGRFTITLQPTGARQAVERGARLHDLLFEQGVEFPCGGQGRCRGCRVRIVSGRGAVNATEESRLTAREIAEGWRLACQCRVEDDLEIELRQWESAILTDEAAFAFTPREGYGIAVDLGTTTLAAQLLDLETGHVRGVKTALNPQARYGADVMSRVEFALTPGGAERLTHLIRHQIGQMAHTLVHAAGIPPQAVRRVAIVGNTVMHHLFCGIDLEPMSHVPFEPVYDGERVFSACDLEWSLSPQTPVVFLPCLGGFVGSDILAGVLATGLHRVEGTGCLIDLGTNGEIVMGGRNGLICTSTAAGPAFEGARIAMGMRAATGAIYQVEAEEGALRCATLGGGVPTGICGSGLVDAAAAELELGLILPTGRIATVDRELPLAGPVRLTQADIRQLQLAKGAIAAGVQLLLERCGATAGEVSPVTLAGAFGNYVRLSSAKRIGLLPFPIENIRTVGNTALLGAKMALFAADWRHSEIRALTRHLSLHADPHFQYVYIEEMGFPAQTPSI